MQPGLTAQRQVDGALVVTLDRAQRRNAFDEGMMAAMLRLFREDACSGDVRAVVLRGSGSDFCAGYDLKARSSRDEDEGIALAAAMYQALADIPVITIALVDGVAYGGAIGLVAACDMVVATRAARFACPEGRHGILPGVMAVYLTRAIGERHALAMIATASPVPAEQACGWGLVSEVVDDAAALDARAAAMLRDIRMTGPDMARRAKALVRLAARPSPTSALIDEAVARAAKSRWGEEAREGGRAFRENRPPAWQRVG